MTLIDKIRTDLDYVSAPLLVALEIIQGMTGVGGPAAADALKAIDAVVKTAINGAAGGADPAQILADLQKLQATTVSDDAAADAALAGKFPQAGG